jgi:hypothetical protein
VNLFLTGLFFFQWEVGYARFRRLMVASLSSHIVVHLLVSREKSIWLAILRARGIPLGYFYNGFHRAALR